MKPSPLTIDLNTDVAEIHELVLSGEQEKIMSCVSSVNISCGAHAGSDELIERTLASVQRLDLKFGAHPGYADPDNFGRRSLQLDPHFLTDSLCTQLEYLSQIAKAANLSFGWVKPHGALYNDIASHRKIAECFAKAILLIDKNLAVIGLAHSGGLRVLAENGIRVIAEAFIDRRYEKVDQLSPRGSPNAVISDASQSVKQALEIIVDQKIQLLSGQSEPLVAQTLCVHSDTPGALNTASSLRKALTAKGILIKSFLT